jgi:hypothetical protein
MDEKEYLLSHALYALNALLPLEREGNTYSAVERMNLNKLEVARDYIWSQLQAINPNEWKD